MDRAAADDVDGGLELAVRVRLRARVRRHDDEVQGKALRARRLPGHAEVVRDLLFRLERLEGADAHAAVVARKIRPCPLLHAALRHRERIEDLAQLGFVHDLLFRRDVDERPLPASARFTSAADLA